MIRTVLLTATLIGLGICQADASPVSFTASPNGVPDPGFTAIDFGAPPPGVTIGFSGPFSGIQTGSSPTHAAPYLNGNGSALGLSPNTGPDADPYASSGGPGNIDFQFSQPQTQLDFYYGSIDPRPQNVITLLSGGVPIQSFGGEDIQASANGDRGPGGSEFVKLLSTIPVTEAIFHADWPAVELAALYLGPQSNPVSEPASLVLLGTGLLGVGILARKRRAPGTAAC